MDPGAQDDLVDGPTGIRLFDGRTDGADGPGRGADPVTDHVVEAIGATTT